MKRLVVWAIVLAIPPVLSGAGDIKGVVTVKTSAGDRGRNDPKAVPVNDVVVWVTGLKATSVPQARPVLSQRNMEFAPSMLVVVAGQTVAMPNDDELAHNVISSSPAKPFNLGIYPKGDTKLVTFDQVGLVDVRCSVHRRMSAAILVVPNTYYALTTNGSRYRISDLPAGTYTVKAWKQGLGEVLQQVVVPDRGEVALNFVLAGTAKQASAQ